MAIAWMGNMPLLFSQTGITLPQASQKVNLTQRVGITDMTITYSSPQVNGRALWGQLIPLDQVWRAGANENTTIRFAHDVQVEGKPLSAGTYGLHMIPTSGDWTIIFSKNSTSWGSYSYREAEDALRVQVKPQEGAHQEFLTYTFQNPASDGATLELAWGNMRVPVRISIDTHEIMLANIRNELRSSAGFSWMGYQQAANYCLQNGINYEEALTWIDQSISGSFGSEANFTNLSTKAQLLGKMNRQPESEVIMKEALAVASNQELYSHGAQLIGNGQNEQAMKVFQLQAERFPDTWLSYAGLAAGNRVQGNHKAALEYYRKAKVDAPHPWQASLDQRIASMEEAVQAAKK